MANNDDYLTTYRKFFEYFAQTVNPNDQLPVKLASYKLLNVEVVGGIIDWTTQYLTQKQCPPHLLAPIIKIIIDEIRKACKKNPSNYGFNISDNAYEPLKLMQAVMAKANEVCLRYLDNSMLCSLPTPTNTYFETSTCAVKNRRRMMEDRHVVIHDLNTMFNIQEASPSSYYAVFDGHAGHDAAAYSSAHLHQFLAENKHFISNPEQALIDAFCKTDVLFIEKCKVESLGSGTTAVVALLRPKEKSLYIAWVGDSQAVIVNQGKILQCVDPHKPCRQDEKERIEKAGGCVMHWGTWRVNGQLAVSRAIGDSDYKPYVIAIPDVREISLDGGEDFLILACDGLWDVLTEDVAAQEVYYLIAENPDNTDRISAQLVQLARYQGSSDNISVIVVFLREPHKIAAEAHRWATRNGPPSTRSMDTELDNANNPFTNSNGTFKNLETDNIHIQKNNDGLLLNLTDNFKAVGTNLTDEFFVTEKSNGTKLFPSDINSDEDLGPETDIDTVDEAVTPVEKTKSFADTFGASFADAGLPKTFNEEVMAFAEGLANNNPLKDDFNPFEVKESNENKEDAIEEEEEDAGERGDECCRLTPPIDTNYTTITDVAPCVHDVSGLEENPADSDSEDEWNYIKGDQAKPENLSSQPETVVETAEDAMSQLNPNAAEFVPVSPTRSIPSPPCRNLINEEVIAQSPKRPLAVDISVPNEKDFEKEIKSRPSDVDTYSNGHKEDENDHNNSSRDLMEDILNGKNIDDIPEFHPGSTPAKVPASEEFHFGPNAAPFTPRLLDQSEAFSTKANYGDDTEQTLNESEFTSNKDTEDPMSMSFYAEKGEANPFEEDLNKVHELPDNLDEFLQKEDNGSRLPPRDLLNELHDNDQAAIQTTDLDKLSQDDEKELASPLEPDQDIQLPTEHSKLSSEASNLLDDFVVVTEKPFEGIPLETVYPTSEICEIEHAKSFALEETRELCETPEIEQLKSPSTEDLSDISKSPLPEQEFIKSPLPGQSLGTSPLPDDVFSKSPLPEQEIQSPVPADIFSKSPEPQDLPGKSPVPEQEVKSPLPIDDLSKSPLLEQDVDIVEAKSPELKQQIELIEAVQNFDIEEVSKSPLIDTNYDLLQSKSPIFEEISSPVQEALEVADLLKPADPADLVEPISSAGDSENVNETKSPVPHQEELISCSFSKPEDPVSAEFIAADQESDVVCEFRREEPLPMDNLEDLNVCSKTPVSDTYETEFNPKSEVEQINVESKTPEVPVSQSLGYEYPEPPDSEFECPGLVELQEQKQEEDIQHEEITSSVKDDISSPIDQLSPMKSPEPLIEEQFRSTEFQPADSAFVIEQIQQNETVSENKETHDLLFGIACPLPLSQPEAEILAQSEQPILVSQPIVENEPLLQTREMNLLESSPVPPTTLSNGFDNLISQVNEEISIKTESIHPEFAEQTIITPSEESKILDDVPTAPLVETPVEEPKPEIVVDSVVLEQPVKSPEPTETPQEAPKDVPALAPLPVVATTPKEAKKEEKKVPSATKKPIGKVPPTKSTIAPSKTGAATKSSAKPLASSPKTGVAPKVPPKTGASRLSASPSKTTTTTKPSPKPKTATAPAPKSIERKPLTNGDVKPAPRTLTRKPLSEAPATKTTTRPATAASKPSQTKTTAAPRPATAPRPAPRPTTLTTSKTTTSATTTKPKTTTPSRTSLSATNKTTTSSTATKTTLSPRTATATAPKPKTLSSVPPKPRAPITKTITKSADVEKQNKDSANKITASRTTTVSKTSSTLASSRTTTTTLKKTELKPLPKRPITSKTTTTTTKTTLTKKPGDVKALTKTKTTKVEKPKENGIASATVTEEIKELTIVSNSVVETENLLKDNSPIDNKLLAEGTIPLIEPTATD